MLRGIFAQVATVGKELKRVVTVVVDIWASATPLLSEERVAAAVVIIESCVQRA